MTTILIILANIISLVVFYFLIIKVLKPETGISNQQLQDNLAKQITQLDAVLRSEFKSNREELLKITKDNRSELKTELQQQRSDNSNLAKEQRQELTKAIENIQQSLERQLKVLNDNNKQELQNINETVNEKLQKTLNERLSTSFKTVSTQLESVQKGLGEMQTLASDVGGLKKVLTNVKARGIFGEVQLSMLLEEMLSPQQYLTDVATIPNSSQRVEFAIKLPGKSDGSQPVLLPIDAKFPKEVFEKLADAYEAIDKDSIKKYKTELEQVIKAMAKDIQQKYIEPPHTTNFGILFLPFESLYSEVVSNEKLFSSLQTQYNITVAGPTTIAALLNSLQMGFKTLAIQQRSSEVWQVLGKVKSEFDKFGGLMDKAQKNIQTGLNTLEDLSTKRTRAIERSLRNVEQLEATATNKPLQLDE